MEGLFASVVEVLRQTKSFVDGTPTYVWTVQQINGRPTIRVRLAIPFSPPGTPLPIIEAGRAPDRTGMVWIGPRDGVHIRTGDRLRAIKGPITGTFSIETIPDQIGDYSTLHHFEIPITEVSQLVATDG